MYSIPKKGDIGLSIVKFNFEREDKDCERLIFCNARWFPGFDNDKPLKDFIPTIPPLRSIYSNSAV